LQPLLEGYRIGAGSVLSSLNTGPTMTTPKVCNSVEGKRGIRTPVKGTITALELSSSYVSMEPF